MIPQPVYMNSQQLFRKPGTEVENEGGSVNNGIIANHESSENDDDLKTPTVEELSFPGNVDAHQKVVSPLFYII